MKRTINHILAFSILMVISLTGCLKGNDVNLPASAGDSYLQLDNIQNGGTTINSGLNYFNGGSLTYPATDVVDTATYSVYLGGTNTLNKDIPVTISIDASALRDNYNNDSIAYLTMPDSLFKLVSTTGTITSGTRVATFKVVFYPSKFDVTKSFILPIKVTNTAGITVSTNYGHIYFHAIGNPLAGSYKWDFTRYSAPSNAGSPDGNSFTGKSTVLLGLSPLSLEVASGYYIGPKYEITFTNASGLVSNIKVTLNATDITKMSDAGVIVTDGPNILMADPIAKIFTFQYKTLSRYVIDSYHK